MPLVSEPTGAHWLTDCRSSSSSSCCCRCSAAAALLMLSVLALTLTAFDLLSTVRCSHSSLYCQPSINHSLVCSVFLWYIVHLALYFSLPFVLFIFQHRRRYRIVIFFLIALVMVAVAVVEFIIISRVHSSYFLTWFHSRTHACVLCVIVSEAIGELADQQRRNTQHYTC